MKRPALFTGFVNRLRDDKRLETAVIASMLIAALAIFLLSGGQSCSARTETAAKTENTASSFTEERELESRLEEILSRIDGAGRVRVMITYGTEADPEAGESRKSDLFSGSYGEVKTQVSSAPPVRGVIVVAEGARDIKVRIELEAAVMTVLGTEPAKIGIFPMEQ
ncbi:MAG: hypothetical protein J5772_07975 [Clostridia bacterium]|nr:hypothetical protein [Clostridia bacterium]